MAAPSVLAAVPCGAGAGAGVGSPWAPSLNRLSVSGSTGAGDSERCRCAESSLLLPPSSMSSSSSSSAFGSRRRNETDAAASLGRSSRWRSGTEAVVAGRSWRAHPAALAWAAAALRWRSSVEFQWFLTELSVRPWSIRAMVAHLLPCCACAATMMASSSGVKARRSTLGLSWLHHRRRHDLPDRPGISELITVQFRGPCRVIARRSSSSSSGVHDPFTLRRHPDTAAEPPSPPSTSPAPPLDDTTGGTDAETPQPLPPSTPPAPPLDDTTIFLST
uniref:Uncharacterized protein n=1 Tax=Zea mays TaxID=4577 RepID=A0A804PZ04_MAIZE